MREIFTFFLALMLVKMTIFTTPVNAQEGAAGLAVTAEGDGGGDGGDGADANNRSQIQNRSKVLRYVPIGVQQFSQTYPKTHLRFISGDLLSSSFFEVTGLFGFAAGSDPLRDSVERTNTLARHAGLLSFVTTATAGAHAINAVESRVNNRLGIERSSATVTRLKGLAGLNILAGVYAYIAVGNTLNGDSSEQVLETLSSKETLAAAISMHLAFYGADHFISSTKNIGSNLRFLAQAAQNPRALQLMQQGGRGGLAMYSHLLANAEKLDELRRELSKAKVVIGAAQPETIPVLVAQTAAEWTAYYVFAKVWDSLIHERLVRGLVAFDKHCANVNSRSAFYHATNQQGLVFDETIVASATRIQENYANLIQLMYAPYMDEQMALLERTVKVDYLLNLYKEYLALETIDAKREFILDILDRDNDLFELNSQFVDWLIQLNNEHNSIKISRRKLNISLDTMYEINNHDQLPPDRSQLGLATVMRDQRRLRSQSYQDELDGLIDQLNYGVNQVRFSRPDQFEERILSNLNQEIASLEQDQADWADDIKEINGMSVEAMEASYAKFGVDPTQDSTEQRLSPRISDPKPETIFEVMLMQNLYLNELRELAWSEKNKQLIQDLHTKSEIATFVQAGALENISATE